MTSFCWRRATQRLGCCDREARSVWGVTSCNWRSPTLSRASIRTEASVGPVTTRIRTRCPSRPGTPAPRRDAMRTGATFPSTPVRTTGGGRVSAQPVTWAISPEWTQAIARAATSRYGGGAGSPRQCDSTPPLRCGGSHRLRPCVHRRHQPPGAVRRGDHTDRLGESCAYDPPGIARPWQAMHNPGFFARARAALNPGPCGLNRNPPPTAE